MYSPPHPGAFQFNAASVPFSPAGGTGNDGVLTRVASVAPNILGITPVTPEPMQILGQGVPGASYVLEATLHLKAPLLWTPIATNTADAFGFHEFIDPYADNGNLPYPQRFYRVRWP